MLDLEPLKKIMAAATIGPMALEAIDGKHDHDVILGYEVPHAGNPILVATVFWDSDDGFPISLKQANANAKMVLAAWNTMPSLVAELERLRSDVAKLDTAIVAAPADGHCRDLIEKGEGKC